jgi:hypothetical protein
MTAPGWLKQHHREIDRGPSRQSPSIHQLDIVDPSCMTSDFRSRSRRCEYPHEAVGVESAGRTIVLTKDSCVHALDLPDANSSFEALGRAQRRDVPAADAIEDRVSPFVVSYIAELDI